MQEPPAFCPHSQLLQDGREHTVEIHEEGLGGDFLVRVCPLRDAAESLVGSVHIARDVTEQRRSEAEPTIVIEVLRLVTARNNRHELLRAVTALLHAWSGCEAVGVRLCEGEDFPYFETRGLPHDFVLAESRLCTVGTDGEIERDSEGNPVLACMCGNVIRGRFDPAKPFFTARGSFWTNSTSELLASTTEADRQGSTRSRCHRQGFESLALIPLRASGETFGLLQLADCGRERFTPRTIAVFERLADSVALGLAHRQAEEKLRASEERLRLALHAAATGIWEWHPETGEIHWSEHVPAVIGVPAEQFGSGRIQEFADLVHAEDRPQLGQAVRAAIESRSSLEHEFRIVRPNGEARWLAVLCGRTMTRPANP